MGNCFGSSSSDRNFSHVYNSTTPGTSNNCSNNMESSATSSVSNCRSQFSQTVSEIVEEENPDGRILETPNLKVFTLVELKSATKNFNTLLGEGGFGKVYKGWLDEKTLAPSKPGSGMISEVNFLGRLSHPNLVKLLGYCWEEKELLLVYEFMQKGSLENHLFRRNPAVEPMSWETRLKIAIGAARGLAFLHFSEKVIYRDFKASNILLDGNYNAKISDFGLAKLGPSGGDSHRCVRLWRVVARDDDRVEASDTKRPDGQQNLVDWLKPTLSHKRKYKTLMDGRIEGQYSSKAASLTAELTLKCLEHDPKNRPSMKEVAEALERIESLNKERSTDSSKSSSIHSSTNPRYGQKSSSHRDQSRGKAK
ncbi:putative serine/threonine-protein kinase Cx32 [Hibiscus syriacus]|uniref:non-specific serine/threonine protein kinase n=1 Tax=Hibiscus syriacus TaxID=106335 RepID=A0A6A3C576_HIBSY|nr:putative serine/threonine-protein kinase Cx32 [Hibiscus syriacus]